MSEIVSITVNGAAGVGKSVIIGLIVEALKDANIVSDITNLDTEMVACYPTIEDYINRAKSVDRLRQSQDHRVQVYIDQVNTRRAGIGNSPFKFDPNFINQNYVIKRS